MSEKTKTNLPATQERRLRIISDADRDQYSRMQIFEMSLHRPPNVKKIKEKSVGDGRISKYLPIGEIETMLDQDFFGLWSTERFTTKVIANEIVGEIVLKLFHPAAQCWIERIGSAAVQIQMKPEYEMINGKRVKKPTDITDITKKIQNTLEKDYPHLKAQCLRNAAQSLGAKYGRNLNRDDVSNYVGLMRDAEAEREQTHNDLKS